MKVLLKVKSNNPKSNLVIKIMYDLFHYTFTENPV